MTYYTITMHKGNVSDTMHTFLVASIMAQIQANPAAFEKLEQQINLAKEKLEELKV